MNDIKKISIITNYNIQEKLVAAMKVAEKVCEHVPHVYIPNTYKERIMRAHMHKPEFVYSTVEEIYESSDLVIGIGGDGVMLEAARRATPAGIPILGINMGRVGYMTELEMNELDMLDEIFKGNFHLDERAMLRVEIKSSKGSNKFSAYALNEAVIANGTTARIIDLELEFGNYTVIIKKDKYITLTLSVIIDEEGSDGEVFVYDLIPGDIIGGEEGNETAGDNIIDIDDFVIAIRSFDPASDDAVKAAADINEDGFNNVTDLGFIKANFNKTTEDYLK